VTIGDAKVNTSNGTVTFKVFGYDVVIDAKQYIKPPPTQVNYAPGVAFTVNDESGKCLDVHHGDFKAGTRLWQYDCSKPNKAQEFRLLSDGTLRTGDNSRWCVSGKDRQPQLADCNHQPVQVWYRDEQGRIRGSDGKELNLCLDVAGHSKASQAYTTLTACTGKDKSERWVMDGLLRREGEGCLDVPKGDIKAALAVFHHCNGTENQAFALYPNGELKVRGLCVEASKTYGAAVRLAGCTGSVEQRWGLRSGQLCIGKMNDFGFDARDAQCMASQAKQGEYYPVQVAGYSRNSGAYFWQLTF
jgi:hypothetical protein